MTNLFYPMLYIARKEKGDTQKEVAKKLSITPQRYQLKETGKANFTLPEAKILSEMYITTCFHSLPSFYIRIFCWIQFCFASVFR